MRTKRWFCVLPLLSAVFLVTDPQGNGLAAEQGRSSTVTVNERSKLGVTAQVHGKAGPRGEPTSGAAAGRRKLPVKLAKAYAALPLYFEANRGQASHQVSYLARTSASTIFLTSTGATLVTNPGTKRHGDSKRGLSFSAGKDSAASPAVVQMKIAGADPMARITGEDLLETKINYLMGSDPRAWLRAVPVYSRVRYRHIYPGTDLVLYGNDQQLEFDFVLSPGADPKVIELAFEGADAIDLGEQGQVILQAGEARIELNKPCAYQETGGRKQPVEASYRLLAKSRVGIRLGAYDRDLPLVIDPLLAYGYSTYLGGAGQDWGEGIAVDGTGAVYVTGATNSLDFPTAGPFQGSIGGGTKDAFVSKLDPSGSTLVYSTYLGGSAEDWATALAVDASGSAVLAGWTSSPDFPTASSLQGAYGGGDFDAFVAKLSADGSVLIYSTYLGGSWNEQALGIGLDAAGDAYVAGWTNSSNFPVANALQGLLAGSTDAFVTKISADGSVLVYSTYLGGQSADEASGIAVDASGSAYVAGYTYSDDFPMLSAVQGTYAGAGDAFVTKMEASGASLAYSTYLGGSSYDNALAVAVDASGRAVVAGTTRSTDFPVASAAQSAYGGGLYDAFVATLSASGSSFIYSSYLGGSSEDQAYAVAVDRVGDAYCTGETMSADFPLASAIQAANAGARDGFVSKFSAGGLAYSTYIGGGSTDWGSAIAVDGERVAYIAGKTDSADFPTASPLQGSYAGGPDDAFIVKLLALCQVNADCDDYNVCTTDVCAPGDPGADASGCVYINNTDPCDDNDPCTVSDTCQQGSCVGVHDPSACLDHFLCYRTKVKQEISVSLSDAYDSGTYSSRGAKLFCTPADKDGSGILDPDTHLIVYKIKGPHQRRVGIEVSNQFGTYQFDTKRTSTLMVPAAKSLPPDPPPGPPDPNSLVDHYRCLKVRLSPAAAPFPRGLQVSVSDQFGSRTVFVKKPVELCVPTDKSGEGIKRPANDLVCYRVKASPRTRASGVQVQSQFGQQVLNLSKETELCVPSVDSGPGSGAGAQATGRSR